MACDISIEAVFGHPPCDSTPKPMSFPVKQSNLTDKPSRPKGEELVLDSEKDGPKKYIVRGKVDSNDENSAKVLSFGNTNEKPTKCILLLGETGAGKTTFVNATLNHLHNIQFTDNFRYCVEDQVTEKRGATESQTDFITVFKFHHTEGMKYDCNFVIIDTPGMADTRGEEQQSSIMKNLEEFFLSDNGIDNLHCLGLTTNATINRRSTYQNDIIDEILGLLGKHVPDITNIIATHATEKAKVDQVMESAGVKYSKIYEFDNHAVFAPNKLGEEVRLRDLTKNGLRWEDMQEQYTSFLSDLLKAKSISVRILRERKRLDITQRLLTANVEKLAMLWTTTKNIEKELTNHTLQKVDSSDYKQEEEVLKTIKLPTSGGSHAHNCSTCNQTCKFCPVKETFGATVIKSMGKEANTAANTVRQFIPGKVALGLVGGLAGGVVGVGKATQAITKSNCLFNGNPCSVCGHTLQEHSRENETIKSMKIKVPFVNKLMRTQFDEAVLKMKETTEAIDSILIEINTAKEEVVKECLNTMVLLKTVQKLSPSTETMKAPDLVEQLTPKVEQESDHSYNVANIWQTLKETIHFFDMCDIDKVFDNHYRIASSLEYTVSQTEERCQDSRVAR